MQRVVNTSASIRQGIQMPRQAADGTPVSFVDQNREPVPRHKDAVPPAPRMPDRAPGYLDPAPDAQEEDEDDRPGDPNTPDPEFAPAFTGALASAMNKIREGYIELGNALRAQGIL